MFSSLHHVTHPSHCINWSNICHAQQRQQSWLQQLAQQVHIIQQCCTSSSTTLRRDVQHITETISPLYQYAENIHDVLQDHKRIMSSMQQTIHEQQQQISELQSKINILSKQIHSPQLR